MQYRNMNYMKRNILMICAIVLNLNSIIAQSLSGEARSHWNKASIYIENASSEKEWQMAINELEQVVKLESEYAEAYIKLGDAYSHLSTAEAVRKAKYYWKEYEKRVPSACDEIQDKIDRLEAQFEITSVRNREKIIESLIGRWRGSKDDSSDFWQSSRDIEIFREGNNLMLRFVNFYWYYNGGRGEPGGITKYKEIGLDGDSIVIEYEYTAQWRDEKDGRIVDKTDFEYKIKYIINQSPIDGVIKGFVKCYCEGEALDYSSGNTYLYKVN